MVPNNRGDFRVGCDLCQNSLSDLGVLLHISALLQVERTRFSKSPAWSPIFPMSWTRPPSGPSDLLVGKPQSRRDVASVDRDGGRMACGVSVSGVKGCDECGCEREVRFLEISVSLSELMSPVDAAPDRGQTDVGRRVPEGRTAAMSTAIPPCKPARALRRWVCRDTQKLRTWARTTRTTAIHCPPQLGVIAPKARSSARRQGRRSRWPHQRGVVSFSDVRWPTAAAESQRPHHRWRGCTCNAPLQRS